MTKEEFKSRIEDIIDDNRIYGWDTMTVLIMEEIDKTLPPPFNVDWEQRRYEIAKSAMNGILSNENQVDFARSEVTYKEHEKHTMPRTIARYAVSCADILIEELKKYDYGKDRI